MLPIQLDTTWSSLMRSYDEDHQHPLNQACHKVGIPLIAGSIPVAATLVGLPLAASMFTTGWVFQFVGHAIEGKKPSFVDDKRMLVVGLLWWLEKNGLPVVQRAQVP